MPGDVNRDLRAARRADTEVRIVEAATELFVERGYVATTLADVAKRAGVGARTVYVRFATKAALLQRCLDVAIAGDHHRVAVPDRDWFQQAMNAPTAQERIARMAGISRQLMDRTGSLLQVAQQAEAVEPEIAERAQAARAMTHQAIGGFFRKLAADGLMSDENVDWVAETGAVLGQAETYLLLTRTTGWSVEEYESWLAETWTRLVGTHS
ncbi:TetR/AcrR family transcriptional regulator [Lentzea aerocolonigenes]|uniref:TetR/AcrR family transcriptional regulator n=1 Tax=Lentzea aerocolonigenes TaxID=68170 RepID=UPI0004C2D75C|nr:TetR/AcrR family transcriptional regulator [Lentzea aerocolonigenes]MCP2245102.1 transcriptional regulator, TetR family [Lentzea aerocolonigenes]